jgi:hypothetical protein
MDRLLAATRTARLVYQAGIANVFAVHPERHGCDPVSRLFQADFCACEDFVQGLRAAGITVLPAMHCNAAGDIAHQLDKWSADLDAAPFRDKMRLVVSSQRIAAEHQS